MLRKTIVISLAIAVLIGIEWLRLPSDPLSGFSYFGPVTWSYLLGHMALETSRNLLPGFIIGAFLTSRQILTGALVSALTEALVHVFFYLHFLDEQPTLILLLPTVIYACVYGSAGSALGLLVLGSNNSVRDSPLKVSATPVTPRVAR